MNGDAGSGRSGVSRRAVLRAGGLGTLGLALGHARGALAADDRGKKAPRNEDDPPPRELVAEVTLPARRFAVGDPIPFTFRITNNSTRPVVIWSSGFWPNHLVDVRDAKGRTPPLTAAGKERRRAFAPGGPRRQNFPVKLEPGESLPKPRPDKKAGMPDNDGPGLESLFELKPGAFTLQVTYHDEQAPTPLKLISAKVAFEVIIEDEVL